MKIFLDLDGVMVPVHPKKKTEFEKDGMPKFSEKAVERLKEIIAEHKDCEIVLSTSHRFYADVLFWWWLLDRRGINIGDGDISRIETPTAKNKKELILNWINECGYTPEEVLILDDDKSLNGLPKEWKERLIMCDPMLGLI